MGLSLFAIEKDKSSNKRQKLTPNKTGILFSWVNVGASNQLDPFKHQQESNPILNKGTVVLSPPYEGSVIQQILRFI